MPFILDAWHMLEVCNLTVTCANSQKKEMKKQPNFSIRVFSHQKLVCEEFSDFINLIPNASNKSSINY